MYVLFHDHTEVGQFEHQLDALKAAHSMGKTALVLVKKGFEAPRPGRGQTIFWELRLVTTRIPETTPYTLNEAGQFLKIPKEQLGDYHDVFEFSGAMSDGSEPDFWLDLINGTIAQYNRYYFGQGHGEQKALFLDRDGVLIHDSDYPSDPAQVSIREDVVPLLLAAQKHHYLLIVVTNQSGVARGLFDVKTVERMHDYLRAKFSERGVDLTRWYYCPYHLSGQTGPYQKISHYRKPYPGMFLQACAQDRLDLGASLMIGDKLSDQPLGLDLKTFFIHDPVKSKTVSKGFYPDFVSLLKDLPF